MTTSGLGAPIFNSDGEVVGDICLTVPESCFDPGNQDRIAELLKNCAHEVTKAIGGRRAPPYNGAIALQSQTNRVTR